MPAPTELILTNALSELKSLQQGLEIFASDHVLPLKVAFNLDLVLEELVTNAIKYGLDGSEEHLIIVRLWVEGGEVMAQLEDEGRPFDPFAEAQAPDLDSPVQDRPIGGVGLHLVKKLMDTARYERTNGKNIITVSKRIAS